MAAYLRPGVYVQETLNPIAPITGANSNSVAAFLGASNRGPVTPTLVTSWSEFVNTYGGWDNSTTTSNDLALAVFLFFSNGGNQAYIQRVFAGTTATASRNFNDQGDASPTLAIYAKNLGAWGNDIAITTQVSPGNTDYFDLIVYYQGTQAQNKVETFPNLSMTISDDRYAISIINSQSNWILALDLNSSNTGSDKNPVAVTGVSLAGGNSGSEPTEHDAVDFISGFDLVQNSLILNSPRATSSELINAMISYAEARRDVFVVIDPVVNNVSTQLSTAAGYTASSYAAVYYPSITINDPTNTTPGTVIMNAMPGGAIVGKYAATDKSRGVFKAPAGLSVRVAGAVSVEPLTNANLDSLNSASAPVNALRFIPGSGIVVMGARTLKGGYADMYVPVRRSLIYLEKSLTELTQFAVFEPNDTVLYRNLTSIVNGFLTNFWSQGGLRGATPEQAFFVLCDETNNTLATVEAGQVNIQVGVALQRPAEFVVINIGQFDGGATVTVA